MTPATGQARGDEFRAEAMPERYAFDVTNVAVLEGVYPAQRASQLSGVPVSTVHYWARTNLVVPSISPVREKFWSFADLLALRVVSWLRHAKRHEDQAFLRSTMPDVRIALSDLASRGRQLFDVDENGIRRCVLLASPSGQIAIADRGTLRASGSPQLLAPLDILAEYRVELDSVGPDLVVPRPHLRIVPGKLAGEPHLQGSRIATSVISGLSREGYSQPQIAALYPQADREAIAEAIEFEGSLAA